MSDQEDFFFDEEEKPAEPKKAAPQRSKTPATTAAPAAAPSFASQSVTMPVAGLIAVCALLVGVIVGILVGGTGTDVPAPTATSATSGQVAPQLSEDQLNSGQLPEGHPTIGGSTTPTATESK